MQICNVSLWQDLPLGKHLTLTPSAQNDGTHLVGLTAHGSASVRVARALFNRRQVFARPNNVDHNTLESTTSWEMLALLEHHDWRMKVAPKQKQRRQHLPPYRSGAEKVWYVWAKDLRKMALYLRALLLNEDVLRTATAIRHCEPAKYYKDLLAGKSDGEQSLLEAPQGKKRKHSGLFGANGDSDDELMVSQGDETKLSDVSTHPRIVKFLCALFCVFHIKRMPPQYVNVNHTCLGVVAYPKG